MLILETKTLLMSMLDLAGVIPATVTAADVRPTVEVFRRFAALPVDGVAPADDDGDGVLAQFGTFGFRGRPEFSADLTRQWAGAADEAASTWQLSCTFHWAPDAGTEALAAGHLWDFGKSPSDFFAEAMALPGWAWALKGAVAPADLAITLTEI